MKFEIKLSPKSEKEIKKLSPKDQDRIIMSISSLALSPYTGKKLKGDFQGFYSIRAWPYRIIYTVEKHECLIIVIRVGHRKNIYK